MSVFIVRAFVRLREIVLTNEKLARKVDQIEKRVSHHDEKLIELVKEIRKLIEAPKPKSKKQSIGFVISMFLGHPKVLTSCILIKTLTLPILIYYE